MYILLIIIVKCTNITSLYYTQTDGLNIDGTISVTNNARKGGPDSHKTSSVSGYAFIPDPSKPGQILVDFPVSPDLGECKYLDTAQAPCKFSH